MTRFEHIEYLYLLFLLIPLAVFFVMYMSWRKKARSKMGASSLIQRLMPEQPTYKHQIKFALLALAFTFLVIAFANPQTGKRKEKVQRSGVDFIVALDISKSMLAEDVQPNRIERAKQFISRMIDKMSNDRIGFIVFAGNAYLQVPLTTDYSAAKLFLKSVNTEIAPTQGTAIGEAIRLAEKAFEAGDDQYKALLIISDGENHEGDAGDAANEARKKGIRVHTMGIGDEKGAPIPVYQGRRQVDYKRDEAGSIVLSKMNEQMLQEVAAQGDGTYFRLTSSNQTIEAIKEALNQMEKKDYEEYEYTDFDDQYQYFLAIALFFLILEFFLSEKRSVWFSDWQILKVKTTDTHMKTWILLALCSITTIAFAQNDPDAALQQIQAGNKAYYDADFEGAAISYQKATETDPQNLKGHFNLGDAFYNQQQYEEARKSFELAANMADDKLDKAQAYHNLGNTFMQEKKYKEAVEAYKNSLRNNPKDADTKYNLAYAKKMLEQQQQQGGGQDQNQDQQEQENEEQQEQQGDQNEEGDQQQDQQQGEGENEEQQEGEQQNQEGENGEEQQNENQQQQGEGEQKEGEQGEEGEQGQQKQLRPVKISQEELERMLEAVQQDEQELQQKLMLKQQQGQRIKVEKDW